jgi:hypothetical protein
LAVYIIGILVWLERWLNDFSGDASEEFAIGFIVGYPALDLLFDLKGAALKIVPHPLRCLLRRTRTSWMCCNAQAHVTLEIFMPQLGVVPRRRVLPELGLKSLQHSHNRLCSFVLKHETTSSISVAAIFTQPAPLVATDETKCALKLQINLEVSTCLSQCWKSSPSFKCTDSV